MAKLTDTQLIILSKAAARDDDAVEEVRSEASSTLLERSLKAMVEATGWLPHTTRAAHLAHQLGLSSCRFRCLLSRLLIQRDPPGNDNESNWLPAPKGQFKMVLRGYQPKAELIDGRFRTHLTSTSCACRERPVCRRLLYPRRWPALDLSWLSADREANGLTGCCWGHFSV
jgi:hypothetical protein